MQHLIRNILIAVVVLTLCGVAIFPPSENLRRGRDLAGGVSLVYSVDVAPGENAGEVIDNTIAVLKDRVDPNGLYEINFVRQGFDRIEVTMPLPTDRVRDLRDEFESELAALVEQAIGENELDRVMRLPPDERGPELERLGGGSEPRLELLQAAAEAYDRSQQARRAYREAVESEADQEVLTELVNEAGAAAEAYQEARREVLAFTVSPEDLRAALELSPRSRVLQTGEGEAETIPSPREQAINRLKEEHPGAVEQIERVVEAYNAYQNESQGLDDPNDLIRLLRGAGVLTFRIAPEPGEVEDVETLRRELQERGPSAGRTAEVRWFPLDDITTWYDSVEQQRALRRDPAGWFASRGYIGAERDGVYYMLLYDVPGLRLTPAEGDWSLTSAFRTTDDLGKPAIGFRMDTVGARLLGELTGENVNRPMAVLLDDRVYTAPNLQSRISTQGVITGNFPAREIEYLVRTLSAGSLQAKLSPEPLSMHGIGPELGADNVRSGFMSALIALIAVAAFMMLYYFGAGVIAVIALLCNAIIILGAMSLGRAAFTLPGIAGIVLTFGMAVDANVLIYERIREELEAGADLKTAVRLGYQKVLSTILDANITNLIICLVLYYTATPEIKGFAVTLGIGILATLFSTLFVTRLIYTLLLEHVGVRRMPQLPMVVPALQRVLSPNVNWLRLRPAFLVISTVYVGFGLAMVFHQGEKMLDIEFREGTAVTLQLKEVEENGERTQLTRTRQDIEDIVHGIGAAAPPESALAPLRNAEIIPVDPEPDGVTSDRFTVKTTGTEAQEIGQAITRAMPDLIETRPPLEFDGAAAEDLIEAPVYRLVEAALGENIDRPEVRNDVSDYVGGAAIVIEDIEPRPTLENLRRRLEQMRSQADFAALLGRPNEVVILDGTPEAVDSAVILVRDRAIDIFEDEAQWRTEVAMAEWNLAREALTSSTTLTGVQSISPSIARTFRAQAVVAVLFSFAGIMFYIWLRFGSLRYSLAAVAALMHDVLTTIGLIALAEIVYEASPGVAGALLIEPFKIDLGLIAALLTIIGYSLNDTIVILDRIRENRGKLAYASAEVVNKSINQTVSRTLITSSTTLLAVLIMYVFGGSGIRSFTYALIVGVLIGTYSSIAVAAPLVYSRKGTEAARAGAAAARSARTEPAPIG